MKIKFTLLILCFMSLTSLVFAQTELGDLIEADAENTLFGASTDLSGDATRVVIGEPRYSLTYPDFLGAMYVYELQDTNWVRVGDPIFGSGSDRSFGEDVAISADGNRIASASRGNDDGGQDAGQVRIYDWVDDEWMLVGTINGQPGRRLQSVDLSDDGNRIVVGGPGNFDSSGVVAVYEFDNGSWNQLGDGFDLDFTEGGVSISADGSRIAFNNFNTTDIFSVYEWQNDEWTGVGQIPDGGNFNSPTMAPSGDRVVGWTFNYSIGDSLVLVYELQNDEWVLAGDTISYSAVNGGGIPDFFSFSGNGNRLAIGNVASGGFSGSAVVLEFQNGDWELLGEELEGIDGDDYFGQSVSLSSDGTKLAVGAIALGFTPATGGTGYVELWDYSEFVSTKNLIQTPVDIYPNPTSGEVFISGIVPDQVRIINQSGQVVRYFNNGDQQINLSNLPSGIYFMELVKGDQWAIEKMVKE